MSDPQPQPWWHDLPELDQPADNYLAALTARTDALLARLHATDTPVVVDAAACAAWLASEVGA
jgi:hypothetical protein